MENTVQQLLEELYVASAIMYNLRKNFTKKVDPDFELSLTSDLGIDELESIYQNLARAETRWVTHPYWYNINATVNTENTFELSKVENEYNSLANRFINAFRDLKLKDLDFGQEYEQVYNDLAYFVSTKAHVEQILTSKIEFYFDKLKTQQDGLQAMTHLLQGLFKTFA